MLGQRWEGLDRYSIVVPHGFPTFTKHENDNKNGNTASLKHLSVGRPPHECSWNEVCLMSSCLQGSTHHMHVVHTLHETTVVAVSQRAVKR